MKTDARVLGYEETQASDWSRVEPVTVTASHGCESCALCVLQFTTPHFVQWNLALGFSKIWSTPHLYLSAVSVYINVTVKMHNSKQCMRNKCSSRNFFSHVCKFACAVEISAGKYLKSCLNSECRLLSLCTELSFKMRQRKNNVFLVQVDFQNERRFCQVALFYKQ